MAYQYHMCEKHNLFHMIPIHITTNEKYRPWFWGRVGLFITPWFFDFDSMTMVVNGNNNASMSEVANVPLPF